jgi:hypothetical protein
VVGFHRTPGLSKRPRYFETFEKPQHCHCEQSEAISKHVDNPQDCHVALFLAMTKIEQKWGFCKGLTGYKFFNNSIAPQISKFPLWGLKRAWVNFLTFQEKSAYNARQNSQEIPMNT